MRVLVGSAALVLTATIATLVPGATATVPLSARRMLAVTASQPVLDPTPVTCTLPAVADTFVGSGDSNVNFNAANRLDVDSASSSTRRTLVRFDLSAACAETGAAIPGGAAVVTASLRLRLAAASTSRTHQLRRLVGAWSETTATWSNQPAASASSSGSTTTGNALATSSWTVTADVRLFHTGVVVNNGWLVQDASEGGPSRTASYCGKDGNGGSTSCTSAHRPALVVQYHL